MSEEIEPRGEPPAEADTSVPTPLALRPDGEHTQRMRRVVVEATPDIARQVASEIPDKRNTVAEVVLGVAIITCVCIWVSLGKATVAEAGGLIGGLLGAVSVIPAWINRRR